MYTKQEVFNKVWDVFVTNRTPLSYDNENRQCIYRNEINGHGCAIGIFIENQKLANLLDCSAFNIEKIFSLTTVGIYDRCYDKIDGYSFQEFEADIKEFSLQFPRERHFTMFLFQLQEAHDCAGDPDDLKYLLEEIAKSYELDLPE